MKRMVPLAAAVSLAVLIAVPGSVLAQAARSSESVLEKIKAEQAAAEAKAKEEEKQRAEAEAKRLAEEAAKEAERQRKEAEAETRRLAAEEAHKEAKRQQEARRSKCVILSAMSDDEINYCKKVWAEPDL